MSGADLCVLIDRRVGLVYVGVLGPGGLSPKHTLSATVLRHQGGWRMAQVHLRGGPLSLPLVERLEALAASVEAAA